MPLSRLENFLVNTDGNILYVNPSDLDATDSFDNKGNSLTRPFVTIQRALIEAARFAYQSGPNNDRFDRTTVLIYPGEHVIDNRPGIYIKNDGGVQKYFNIQKQPISNPNIELTNGSDFNLNNEDNILYKFNSVNGGVIVPKGTSIVGLDLRKTKIRPLYVPNPDVADDVIPRSALFRVTGGCYFWQFSMFDANKSIYYSKDFTEKRNPRISHHKLTCFEYADGLNVDSFSNLTDLQMYYFKLMNAYGANTGNRNIPDFPTGADDFEPNTPETKIVGNLSANDIDIVSPISSSGLTATVNTNINHNLSVDDQILVTGVGNTFYDGTYSVSGITSETQFSYLMDGDPPQDNLVVSGAKIKIEADSVTGASPYIFNCSLRSVFGMCGLHADGSKATGFKSMVVAQFTGIGLQKDDKAFVIYKPSSGDYVNSVNAEAAGIDTPLYLNPKSQYRKRYDNFHIKVSNDAFIQAVSVFAIGFSNHFLAESGGEQSITNSNSNFGNKSLVSKGFKRDAFARDDTGYVTHVVPPVDLQKQSTNINWKTINVGVTTTVGISSHLYLEDEKDFTSPPTNITNGFRVGSNKEEKIFLNANINGSNVVYSAPILMQVATGDGPISEKRFIVDRNGTQNNIVSNEITLTENHNLLAGESVKVLSDDGRNPDGIDNGRIYFVINTGANKIKLASTVDNALASTPVPITISNQKGGILTVLSTVTDKIPGDIGHPIQFDSTENNWYILSSALTSTNKIYDAFLNVSIRDEIIDNNSPTYIQRKPETRALDNRIYRLRYVIPKNFSGAKIAKKPEKNYTLQESTTGLEELITGDDALIRNRNPKIIAGISTDPVGSIFTNIVTTELPHKLSVGDKVLIKNILSSTNTTGVGNSGFNGLFTVTSTPSSKIFRYTNTNDGGTFTDNIASARENDPSQLPSFERSEYDTSYTIQEVETIQDYISEKQDGIYYLTCLIGNISPTVSEFSDSKYKQNFLNLYPTIDKDNPNTDPVQTVSAASNEILGKVEVNNPTNSITKESIINYLRDNRVGFAVTNGVSANAGFTTITSNVEHNLNSITALTITVPGSGYAGVSTTLYNLELSNQSASDLGDGATAKVTVGTGGTITSVDITDAGSGYEVGDLLSVGSGNGVVRVDKINDAVGNAIQVVGVGSTGDRNNGSYNGLFKIVKVPDSKSVSYYNIPQGGNGPVDSGIYVDPVGTTNGIFTVLDKAIEISNIVGVANTTLGGVVTVSTASTHGLSVGNKIKLEGFSGTSQQNYNGYDFVVKEKIGLTTFTMDTGSRAGISTSSAHTGYLLKYSLNSYGQDTSLASEKISGSLTPLLVGFSTTMSAGITAPNTDENLKVTNFVGINTGDFLQVDDEVMRVKGVSNINSIDLTVIRGALGTRSVKHDNGSLVRKINVIPSELHRFSAIRASGHTFEYIGYGPGNYSTSLPQKIQETIKEEDELLAISREEKGGVVFFSGMNDRGDFFSGQKAEPRELFLGENLDSNSVTFDDVFIRNTLRVGGGSNQNLPSEFNGPVNFTNKITSTDFEGGIEAIKLLIKGNALNNPSFQVGEDANPSLIVNKSTQNVGIRKADPQHELDVNGTIRANVYENFKLTDLPDATEEVTYARNRIIKVKDDGSGYEMIDPHELPAFELRSLGISNDGTVYSGIGSIVGSKLQISGISTSRFFVGEKVKLFGVTESSDSTAINPPVQNATVKVEQIPTTGFSQAATYYYWQAQYNMKNGKVGVSSQIDPAGAYAVGETQRPGIFNDVIGNLNGDVYNALTLSRDDSDFGILIYRQIKIGHGNTNKEDANIDDAKLIAVLGQRELGKGSSALTEITWKDYGVFEQTEWSSKGTENEFLGSDTSTEETDQIHFPVIGTTGQRRGWDIDRIVSVGSNFVTVNGEYNLNNAVGFGTTSVVKMVHDNTAGFSTAISRIVDTGGNYLNLPSGTYLTNKLVLPTKFTLRGGGKNSIIKQQYYATDETVEGRSDVGAGTTAAASLGFDGNLVGIGTTNPRDMTVQDITFDGNSSNNIMFEVDAENNLLSFDGGTSMLFKDMEIRNSPGGGLYARNSRRISIENSVFVDGGQTDRYNFRPLDVQNSETVRVNDNLFENYPGAVDVSVTTVTATGGNIIRNCGSGIDAYATGKITTTNNVILGPSDEFIASPDIYDTDFDSINITINPGNDFVSPELLYIEDGEGKDLSDVTITAGIGTLIGLFSTTRTASLGEKFLDFTIPTQVTGSQAGNDKENGYFQFELSAANTELLQPYVGAGATGLGYEVIGTEYRDKPVGFSTVVGIFSGYWANNNAFVNIPLASAGVACTQYIVRLENAGQITGFSTGHIVKLVEHEATPDIFTAGLNVGMVDQDNVAITTETGLRIQEILAPDRIVLTGFTTTATVHGSVAKDGDYISIRRIFTIAKGRVGVI